MPIHIAALLLAVPLSAQGPVFKNVTSTNAPGGSANNSRTENVDPGDVDGDGDLDLVFADGGDAGNDQNRIWINQGGAQGGTVGTFTDRTTVQFPAISDTSRDIEFVDFDGDGDLDLYISNASTQQNQTNRWWTNQGGQQGGSMGTYVDETQARWIGLGGPGSSVAPNQVLASGGFIDWSCDCDFGDIDNDGDLDLLHTSYGSGFNGNVPTRLFLNDGEGFFSEWNPSGYQLTGSNISEGVPALWAEGIQNTNTTKTNGSEADIALSGLDADFGDMDGDFDLDILHGSRETDPRFFFNRLEETGTPVFRDVTAYVFGGKDATGTGHYEQEMADMDNDGDLDVYMMNYVSAFQDWYGYNDGTGRITGWQQASGSNADDNEADFIDYDSDGDMDVYVANFSGTDRLYRNNWIPNGSRTLTLVSNSESQAPGGTTLDGDAADFDNDGDYDMIVALDNGADNLLLDNVFGDTVSLTWVQSPINGHYYAATPAMGWNACEAMAVAEGGHLATVRSANEDTWLWNTFGGGGGDVWIGFTDAAVEDTWVWTSGEPVTYTNWNSAQPNNLNNAQHYGQLYDDYDGEWNDHYEDETNIGIIERDTAPPPPPPGSSGPVDQWAASIPNVEVPSGVSAQSAPTVIRAHVYDNSPWYIASFNETRMAVTVDGFAMPDTPMGWAGGQLFRGEIPGAYVGTVGYTVLSSDEHGNTGASAPQAYVAGGSKGIASVGTATPWSGGTMFLTTNGPLAQANGHFALMVGDGPPTSLAVVAMAGAAMVPPLPISGILLNLDPATIITVMLSTVLDEDGQGVFNIPVPDATLIGDFYLQGFGLDGAVPHATEAIRLTPTGPLP